MSETSKDPVAEATARLEAAVARLARAAVAARARSASRGAEADAPGRNDLAALAERLDATILKLRGALGEEDEEVGAAMEREG